MLQPRCFLCEVLHEMDQDGHFLAKMDQGICTESTCKEPAQAGSAMCKLCERLAHEHQGRGILEALTKAPLSEPWPTLDEEKMVFLDTEFSRKHWLCQVAFSDYKGNVLLCAVLEWNLTLEEMFEEEVCPGLPEWRLQQIYNTLDKFYGPRGSDLPRLTPVALAQKIMALGLEDKWIVEYGIGHLDCNKVYGFLD